MPDYSPDDGDALLDPDFDDGESWLPGWLHHHPRDKDLDNLI